MPGKKGRYRKGVPRTVQKIARAVEKQGHSPASAYRIAYSTYAGMGKGKKGKGKK